MKKIVWLLTMLAAVIFMAPLSYGASIVDGPVARNKLTRDAKELLYKEKFGELEKLANELRKSKARFPDGHWKLKYYYDGLSEPHVKGEEQWQRWFKRMENWQRAYPESVTARVAAGSAWLTYGWQARGGGYANKVSEEGWKKLADCVQKATTLANKAPLRSADDCPERYSVLLTIGRSTGMERKAFFDIFDRAIKFEPRYYTFYAIAMDYLTPRWSGEDGEWVSFVEKTDALAGRKDDREIYARLAVGMWQTEWKSFDDGNIFWEKMKKGFEDMEHEYPDSRYNLNNYCKFACIANDKPTAIKLFKRIGDRPYIAAWKNVTEFRKWQSWANDSVISYKSGSGFLKNGSEDFNQTIHLAENGDMEAQYQAGHYFERGEQIDRDYLEAEKWYRKAAEQGHPEAMTSLGMLYSNGNGGIKRDYNEAAKWYRLSALRGYDDNGSNLLGQLYEDGFGVKKDLVKAYVWYSQIFRWKDQRPKQIAEKLTPEQLKQAEQEAAELRKEIMANRDAI